MLTQLVMRSPLNIRPLLGVAPGASPKGLSLFLESLCECPWLDGDAAAARTGLERRILSTASLADGTPALCRGRDPGDCSLEDLVERVQAGDEPIGWGYHFPWQGRAFYQPAWAPTVVCTSFVVDALSRTGSAACPAVLERASRFVLESLHRHGDETGICFSYSPRDGERVYNASLFGARILAGHITRGGGTAHEDTVRAAVYYVAARQNDDGSWFYGDGPKWRWIDGFHTGYVLETMMYLSGVLGTNEWDDCIRIGLEYYFGSLFTPEGSALSRPGAARVLDSHSAAQGIITAAAARSSRFADGAPDPNRMACRAAEVFWNDHRGGFVFRRGTLAGNPAIHSRWSQGWMLLALCRLLGAGQGEEPGD